MESDVQLLEMADGRKDALGSSGFLSVKIMVGSTASDISHRVSIRCPSGG